MNLIKQLIDLKNFEFTSFGGIDYQFVDDTKDFTDVCKLRIINVYKDFNFVFNFSIYNNVKNNINKLYWPEQDQMVYIIFKNESEMFEHIRKKYPDFYKFIQKKILEIS